MANFVLLRSLVSQVVVLVQQKVVKFVVQRYCTSGLTEVWNVASLILDKIMGVVRKVSRAEIVAMLEHLQ